MGSSSTPGKDDAEDVPAGQPEALPVAAPTEQVGAPRTLVVIEESMPEGGEESPEVQLEAEAQTALPVATSSRSPAPTRGAVFTKVSLGASPHYEILRKRRPATSGRFLYLARDTHFLKDSRVLGILLKLSMTLFFLSRVIFLRTAR